MIVAGGSGSRMNADVPKQYMLLKGIPILMHTINVFCSYDPQMRIVVVLPETQLRAWEDLCSEYEFRTKHDIGFGGNTRFHSVKKNLTDIPDHCLIAIHDGVRPLVAESTIIRCFDGALKYGNAVPCIEIPETLRELNDKGSVQVDRTRYRLIQTPQVFESGLLKKAYLQEYRKDFTDDAGVVESMGYQIHLVEGNKENIKITYPSDLLMASTYIG